MKTIDRGELQERLDAVLDDVSRQHATYVLQRDGVPAAVVVPYEAYMQWQKAEQAFRERFDRMLERLDAHNRHSREDEVAADVAAAIAEVRGRR